MQLERRIRDLESSASQGDFREALIGAPPIQFDYGTREAAFEAHGFDIEQIEPPEAPAPRKHGEVLPLDYEGLRARMRQEDALREELKGLDRAEQKKLARREGYRVLYAPEGWMPQPRIGARHAHPFHNNN